MAIMRGSWISGAIVTRPEYVLGRQIQMVEVSMPQRCPQGAFNRKVKYLWCLDNADWRMERLPPDS